MLQRWGTDDEAEDDATTAWEGQEISRPVKLSVDLSDPSDYDHEIIIRTYDDLVTAYGKLGTAMFFDRDELMPDEDENPYWERWKNLEDTVNSWVRWYQNKPAADVPINAEIQVFRNVMGDVDRLGQRGYQSYQAKAKAFRKELARARKDVLKAEAQAKQALRMSFLGGADADLTSSFLWTMTDHLFTFAGELSDVMELPYHMTLAGTWIPNAVTLANVVANWSLTTPAMKGTSLEGLAALNNVISLGGAANGLQVNPGYVVTAYIGPMVSAITKMLGKLQFQLIENNDEAAKFDSTLIRFGVEPGGKKMWNYMVHAMQARSAADISPPSGDVYDYFDDFRDRFDRFNQAKYEGELKSYRAGSRRGGYPTEPDAIPTESSWLVFSEIDASQFPRWLFANRLMVWTVLYGSRDPNRAKPV